MWNWGGGGLTLCESMKDWSHFLWNHEGLVTLYVKLVQLYAEAERIGPAFCGDGRD